MTIDNDKLSGIYQDGQKQEPPAHLDNAILSAARKAVEHDSGKHDAEKLTAVPASGHPDRCRITYRYRSVSQKQYSPC